MKLINNLKFEYTNGYSNPISIEQLDSGWRITTCDQGSNIHINDIVNIYNVMKAVEDINPKKP